MKSPIRLNKVAAFAAAVALGLTMGVAQAADTIKVGTFLSVTGPASFLGDPELKTMQMFIEDANKKGGVLGRQLELIHYDDQTNAKNAATFVKRLIAQDGVDVIVGGSTTGNTMAVIKQVEKAGVPFVSLAGAGIIVNPVKKWVFKTPHTDGVAVGRIFADMTAQLTKIKNAAGIQAFLYCGFGAPTSIVAKNYAQLGISVPHYQTHGSASARFIKGAEGAAEGVRLPAAALLVVDQLPDSHPQKSICSAYKAAYEAKFKDNISTFGGHTYDGLLIVTQAMERAGSTDKEKVRAEIEKTNNLVGVDDIFTMSPTDHLGLDNDSMVMVEVKGGKFSLLK